ncbi:hypothetical protein HYPGJ_31600 [Hyphomicrobium sp. GJ21]|nr:hypothetical protein HYPGJ_31600 [Hyphomicrobium sp. GJ21]
MPVRWLAIAVLVPVIAGWGSEPPPWPVSGPMPDQPVATGHQVYVPVGAGAKNFEPVEPMPWGDVNQRVAPRQPGGAAPMPGNDKH